MFKKLCLSTVIITFYGTLNIPDKELFINHDFIML